MKKKKKSRRRDVHRCDEKHFSSELLKNLKLWVSLSLVVLKAFNTGKTDFWEQFHKLIKYFVNTLLRLGKYELN